MPQPESFVQMVFPLSGIDVSRVIDEQPPGTTRLGQNVRAFDLIAQRARGGQRSGLSKYMQPSVANALIQHIAIIVDPEAPAVGSDDGNGELPGLGTPGQNSNVGAFDPGGYQPVRHKGITLALSASMNSAPADGTPVLLVATVKANGWPAPKQLVHLSTSPGGKVGDGQASKTANSGQATFTVSDTTAESVTYTATLGGATASTTVTYGGTHVAAFREIMADNGMSTATYTLTINGIQVLSITQNGTGSQQQQVPFTAQALNNYQIFVNMVVNPNVHGIVNTEFFLDISRDSGVTFYFHYANTSGPDLTGVYSFSGTFGA